MPRNTDLPRPGDATILKKDLLDALKRIDSCKESHDRVLKLETAFPSVPMRVRHFSPNSLV